MSFQLMEGHVYHSRTETAKNSFKYPIFNIYFLSSETEELQKLFRSKFFNLLGIKMKDYLSNKDPKDFIFENFNFSADKIYLQTIPRMFGYAFNPVNFWYCFKDEMLQAVLCEVNNTFGETHYYWLYEQGEPIADKWLRAEKNFHVSPFFDIEGEYRFRFCPRPDELHVDIHFLNADGSLKLNTWVKGKLNSLKQVSVLGLIFRYGWMTPLVVFRIHYQAIKLFFKKVKFYRKPHLPKKEITYGSAIVRR